MGELLIYGDISSFTWWGDEVTPKQFKEDMDALGDIDVLNVFINSDGGDVFAGQAIYSMLRRHDAEVVVYVDGLAASIASLIAMAGDRVVMPRNAMMMIHHPWTWARGNASAFRKLADDLDKITENILVAYEEKTGMSPEDITPLLDAETWMTADEAVEKGFADEIEATKQVAASIKAGKLVMNGCEFDLSKFRNPPKLSDSAGPGPVSEADQPTTVTINVSGPILSTEELADRVKLAIEAKPKEDGGGPAPPKSNPNPGPQPNTEQQREGRKVAALSYFERKLAINERGR